MEFNNVPQENRQRGMTKKLQPVGKISKMTPLQASRNIILDALDNAADITPKELGSNVGRAMDRKRIRYVKHFYTNQSRPHGHSLEAVSILRGQIQGMDKYFVYKVNNQMLPISANYKLCSVCSFNKKLRIWVSPPFP